jgi:hypothetical protein
MKPVHLLALAAACALAACQDAPRKQLPTESDRPVPQAPGAQAAPEHVSTVCAGARARLSEATRAGAPQREDADALAALADDACN